MDEKSLFSTADLCLIIETCAKSGVAELKFGKLQVQFQGKMKVEQTPAPSPLAEIIGTTYTQSPAEEEISGTQLKIAKQALEARELRSKREELEMMLIENPLEAERLLMDGELEDDEGQEELLD